MIRQTSIETYRQIKDEGLLSKKRMEVYDVLVKFGPLSGAQVSKRISPVNTVSETVRNRITELRDMGVVDEIREDICPVTGRTVIIWDSNDNLPKPLERKVTMKEKKNAILKELRILWKKTKYKSHVNEIGLMVKEL